jgi:hypothetical protein
LIAEEVVQNLSDNAKFGWQSPEVHDLILEQLRI